MPSEEEIRKEQLEDLRSVANTDRGRRFLLRLLEDVCCMGLSAMRSTPMALPGERVLYNTAKHDIGKWLENELEQASPLALEVARKEGTAKNIQKRVPKPPPKDVDSRTEETQE